MQAELARIVEIEPGRAPSALRAQVTIDRARDRLRLRIETERDGEVGRRTLIADDCGQVLRAVTLVLALAYGEGVALRADGPAPSPAPHTVEPAVAVAIAVDGPRAEVDAPSVPAPPASTLPASTLRAAVGVELGASAGVLPAGTFEGALSVELGEPYWRARARASVAPFHELDAGENVLARFTSFAGSLEGCGGAPVGPVRGEVCAGVVLAALYGRAVGSALDREALAPWVGLRGALGVAVALDAVELRLIAAVVWNTVQPRFEITGLGEVHRVGEVSAHGALGVAWLP